MTLVDVGAAITVRVATRAAADGTREPRSWSRRASDVCVQARLLRCRSVWRDLRDVRVRRYLGLLGVGAHVIPDRISLECFLTFLAEQEHLDRTKVGFDHFDRVHLKTWLAWLTDDKHYCPRTITLRISAVKAFLAYAAAEDVTLVALSQSARTLKPPSAPRKPIVSHRGRVAGCPGRVHRGNREVTPQPDAAHPALRHRRQGR